MQITNIDAHTKFILEKDSELAGIVIIFENFSQKMLTIGMPIDAKKLAEAFRNLAIEIENC